MIEVDDEGVERDCGPSTTRVTGLSGEPGRAQRPSSVASRCGVAQS